VNFPKKNNDQDTSKTLKPNSTTPEAKISRQNSTVQTPALNTDGNIQGIVLNPSFDRFGKMEIFENESLKVYILKATHQRQKNFRLLDQMFHIKIEQKNKKQSILLRDLLELFDKIFKYILSHIKTLFHLDDHNIAYLTLYQTPFVNGLNTGK